MKHQSTPPDPNSTKHKAQPIALGASKSLVTIGSNLKFNGSGNVGFKDYQQASLKWIYSVIQSGKLPEEEKSDAADQKETSLVGQFKQLADLAEKVEEAFQKEEEQIRSNRQ